jgi:hypothetical protein
MHAEDKRRLLCGESELSRNCIEKFVRYELGQTPGQCRALQHNILLLMLESVNQKPTPINDLSNLNSLTLFYLKLSAI